MKPAYRILDIGFNVAVAHLADKTARSFRVADIAPHTYEEVIHQIETHGIIVVWSGASEHTIFGDPEINYAFRAWHDWCHWRGGRDFSPAGEIAASRMQCAHLRRSLRRYAPHAGAGVKSSKLRSSARYVTESSTENSRVDQYAFVVDYLEADGTRRVA